MASEFTEIGLWRALICPPIDIMGSGVSSSRLFIIEVSASTAAPLRWHTEKVVYREHVQVARADVADVIPGYTRRSDRDGVVV